MYVYIYSSSIHMYVYIHTYIYINIDIFTGWLIQLHVVVCWRRVTLTDYDELVPLMERNIGHNNLEGATTMELTDGKPPSWFRS